MSDVTVADRERVVRTAAHGVALDCLAAGITAALPANVIDASVSVGSGVLRIDAVDGSTGECDLDAYDAVRLVGAGKAADGMAAAVSNRLGDRLDGGVVVADVDGSATVGIPSDVGGASDVESSGVGASSDPAEYPGTVEVHPGDHPLPSERGVEGARRVIDAADAAGPGDLVVVVVTGGGSALLAAPADPLSVDDLRELTRELLACGASIDEINAVRKHCSAVKGGRLARIAAPATVVTLAVSDVVGDDVGVIASGPTTPDPSTYDDALAACDRYDINVPVAVRDRLRAGAAGERPETPTADDPAFDRARTFVVGNGRTALDAAADAAADRGYDPLVLAAGVRGGAREAALAHVAIAEECAATGSPATPPAVLLSGGETTVTLRAGTGSESGGDDGDMDTDADRDGPGSGGPNGEFAASAGLALDPDGKRIVVASVDTDGIDGATDAAGGVVDATTLASDDARDALDRHDVAPTLDAADALLRTGPTGTNVNDLRVMVVGDPATPDATAGTGNGD